MDRGAWHATVHRVTKTLSGGKVRHDLVTKQQQSSQIIRH